MRTFFQTITLCAAVGCVIVALATAPLSSSVSASSSAKARGAEIFATHGCAHCHGAEGIGGGEGPDLQLVRKRMSKAMIKMQIDNGGKSMPAYQDQLSTAQIDDLVEYLHAKRKQFVIVRKKAPDAPAQTDDPN